MIDDKFKAIMQSNTGCAVIMAGSPSDRPHLDRVIKSLEKYEIPYQERICSAHKEPRRLQEIIDEYNQVSGLVTYIAVAGNTDALSGTLSFHASGLVISSPPDANQDLDPNALNESCLMNPPGSPNVYVGRASNVGKAVAQVYAGVNPRFKELLKKYNDKKIESLREADFQSQE